MTELVQYLTYQRARRISACATCGGCGAVNLEMTDGESVVAPCPTCHFADCRLALGFDNTETLLDWLDMPERPLSPSEIESWILCHRRWGWERLDGIRGPSSEAADLGDRVHKQLERWFTEAVLPDPTLLEGRIAESGLHLWPAPADVTEIEIHIDTQTKVSRYHGYQDVGYLGVDGVWVVGDHKSTGDFKWAKTEEELQSNIQAMIYARSAMDRHRVSRVKLRWGYLRTKGSRKTHLVEAIVDRATVERVFAEEIDPVAREIHAAEASGLTGVGMDVDARACDAFGGCPHRDLCDLSPIQRLESLMAQEELSATKTLSLKEIVQQRNLAKGINPPESALPPAPATMPAATAAPVPVAVVASRMAAVASKPPADPSLAGLLATRVEVPAVAAPVSAFAARFAKPTAMETPTPPPAAPAAVQAAPAASVAAPSAFAARFAKPVTTSPEANAHIADLEAKAAVAAPVPVAAPSAFAARFAKPAATSPTTEAAAPVSQRTLLDATAAATPEQRAQADALYAEAHPGDAEAAAISEGMANRLADAAFEAISAPSDKLVEDGRMIDAVNRANAATPAPTPATRTRKPRDAAMAVNAGSPGPTAAADVHTAIAAMIAPGSASISITLQCKVCQESHVTSATSVSHIELFSAMHKDCK